MPLSFYLDSLQGRKPVTLPTHFSLRDFRHLIEKKLGNPDHYDYSLGDIVFRIWNEEAFNRQRHAIRDGINLIIEYPMVIVDPICQTGPNWRCVQSGLCLQGVCLNIQCAAFEQKVIINEGLGQCLIIKNSIMKSLSCPLCQGSIQANTCAFYNCSWRFSGIKHDQQTNQTMDWQNSHNEFHRWKEILTSWKELTIETKKIE